jgi:hypothetical protein
VVEIQDDTNEIVMLPDAHAQQIGCGGGRRL